MVSVVLLVSNDPSINPGQAWDERDQETQKSKIGNDVCLQCHFRDVDGQKIVKLVANVMQIPAKLFWEPTCCNLSSYANDCSVHRIVYVKFMYLKCLYRALTTEMLSIWITDSPHPAK